MKPIPILSLLLLQATSLSSQSYLDLFKVEWDEGFTRPYKDIPGDARFTELNADLTLPIVFPSGDAIVTGFYADRVALATDVDNTDLTVYGINLKLGINLKHGEKWSGSYILLPRLAGEFGAGDGPGFQLGLFAVLKKQISPEKNLRLGLYANREFFGPFLVPLLGYYHKRERWEFNLLLPLAAEANYEVAKPWRVGAKFNGFIRSYTLQQDFDGYLAKSNNEICIISYLTLGKVVWQLSAGTTLGRTLRTYEKDDKVDFAVSILKFGDDRQQLNEDFKDGFFMKTGLYYRIATR